MFDPELKFSKEDPQGPWDWAGIFGRPGPLALEIGAGNGVYMEVEAARNPDWNFIGLEREPEFYDKFRRRIAKAELTHVRTVCADVNDFSPQVFPLASLERVIINFSDPWPKRKHRDRRVLREPFLDEMERAMAKGAPLQFKTDVGWYFNLTVRLFRLRGGWDLSEVGPVAPPDLDKGDALTNFEGKARRGGIGVWGLTATWVGRNTTVER